MSHTNSTTNYNLPQFLTTDKPAWLTDINGAFSDLDTAVYAAQSKADTAYTDAGNAQGDATSALTNAAAADAKAAGALASIEATFDPTTVYSVGAKVIYNSLLYRCIVAVTTPGPWTGSDNWERITVDSLIATTNSNIGSLGSLATSDKSSVVNAINEVNGIAKGTAVSAAITAQTNISNRNVSTGNAQKANLIIVNMIFDVTTSNQPSLSHKVTLTPNRTIKSAGFIAIDETDPTYSNSGYIDAQGYLHWNAGLRQGTWVVNGYIIYE